MKILLIGNFAPPYEEENLHNLSLLYKLENDGHECTVINVSDKPSKDERFIDTKNIFDYIFKLLRYCWKKDVVHFSTKGYLRLGLLHLMFSVLFGTIFKVKSLITIHSELFSIQGQMRSPVGGRQTLFTTFTLAKKIICSDRDTYNVAAMYMKKTNFELIPTFVHVTDEILDKVSDRLSSLKAKKKIIFFPNMRYPSFVFEILKELLTEAHLNPDTGIVVSISEKPSQKLQHVLEEAGKDLKDSLFFIDPDDLDMTLLVISKAVVIIRPPSCDGITFFENFAVSLKKTLRIGNNIYFPSGSMIIKEGETLDVCKCVTNTLLCIEADGTDAPKPEDSYAKIINIYQEH